jgi:hypothetical protein
VKKLLHIGDVANHRDDLRVGDYLLFELDPWQGHDSRQQGVEHEVVVCANFNTRERRDAALQKFTSLGNLSCCHQVHRLVHFQTVPSVPVAAFFNEPLAAFDEFLRF